MTLKSYFSSTVESAMAQAAKELGSEAMLVYSRETPLDARDWGRYEVVFGWESIADSSVEADPVADVKPSAQTRLPKVAANSTGFENFHGRVHISDPSERADMLIIVGPPGVGKTTTIAKLAFQLGTAAGRRVHLVSTESERLCGGYWLEQFAAITGATFAQAGSAFALQDLCDSRPSEDLVLVEAAGWMTASARAIESIRRQRPACQLHLMLPVTHRLPDLRTIFNRYFIHGPDRIIAARMDESRDTGAVCTIAAETGIPISYLTWGEAIPDGVEQASMERLLEFHAGARTTASHAPESVIAGSMLASVGATA